ncbi:MAG: flagellar motor switch protein FliG, partial [Actinobacteria bacterium]|nr:flagellar motor switch protein FliG [Actinomycetota bacterium]
TLLQEMVQLPPLEPEDVDRLVQDFAHRVIALASVGQGGFDAARRLLRERLGPVRAEEVLSQIAASGYTRPLSFLQRVDPVQVASFFADEHPQVVALVLTHLPPDFAADVLKELDSSLQAQVAYRIGTLGRVQPEVVEQVAEVLQRKLSVAMGSGGTAVLVGGVPGLVGILNNSDRASEKQILTELEELDAELAEEVRSQMFVFDDVVKLDDRTLQRVLRHVVPKDLALALKGVDEQIREKFARNMSERAAEDLREEIEILGPTRLSMVEGAQQAIVRTVRELEAQGEIVLSRGADELV